MGDVPIVVGQHGLVGRMPVRPVEPPDEIVPGERENNALPSSCLREVVCDRPGRPSMCDALCPGKQEDGSCLAEIVRRANAQGAQWKFEVKQKSETNFLWVYVGPPLEE